MPIDPHKEILVEAAPAGVTPQVTTSGSLNIPNIITFSRLILTFVILILISIEKVWIVTTVLFVIAVATDFVDGYLARKWNQVTALGRIMDPFVDKIIIGGTMIFLTPLVGSGVTAWMTFTVIAREMFITALRSVLEGQGVDFSAKMSGKLKMLLQSIVIPLCLLSLSPWFMNGLGAAQGTFLMTRNVLLWVMVAVTVYSGVEYVARGWSIMRGKT
ncbi:CDP-diacylglycerol--glycerol-3-phosphate 3-phosphatidyltransferase [Planctomicrobium piriforme]|uniref:CDP-diacylglycerol--glycerol-3-phosphate 3-phosphatidyltransferase n=1 Tax=Planctomicrobium piriforme TaxID=1576369 RepID=A0A1I3HFH3_9PLAN|nr:CDP-diacylglycerol--glycerol-3-phosphate 3-phosphatidyltransferase [Planctomicrobium piriforme]SFI34486.1 CDP-diacylglycerol--glycerol-3-phosphate 3-phosphatidyltransferase [Planctomicrobium piriforme]